MPMLTPEIVNYDPHSLGAQTTTEASAVTPPAVGGTNWLSQLYGKAATKVRENPELMSIMLDKIGTNIAPNNPFAGVGTQAAKSKLAAEAESTRKSESNQMIQQLIAAITGKDQAGPTTMSLSRDAATGKLQYNLTGLEEGTKNLDTTSSEIIKSSEDFLRDFGGS